MISRQIIYFFSLLAFVPVLSSGQTITNSKLTAREIDLVGKTFRVGEEEKPNKTGNELNLYLIFHQDSSATFRVKRGNIVIKENPLSWRVVGDSLYILKEPITLIAEGKRQYIAVDPIKYAVEKVADGYLLKDKSSQMELVELK